MSAQECVDFLNEAWTPYHAVAAVVKRLLAVGYEEVIEKDEWELKPGGKYFFTRNFSAIIAFAVGAKYQPGNGVTIVGCHTDSPCLKLKPISKVKKSGHLALGVQTYGGGLWHTWFDRELSLAGRVVVKRDGKYKHELLKIEKPLLRIPNLAIHLTTADERAAFKINKESHLVPLLASAIQTSLLETESGEVAGSAAKRHHPVLMKLLAEKLECKEEDIADLDLNVCDTQPSRLFGIKDEFLASGRLDNLGSCFCATTALAASSTDEQLANETNIRAIAFFDHEEVGSESAQGAQGTMMCEAVRRISAGLGQAMGSADVALYERTLRKSFLISCDMAHAVHLNYAEKHEALNRPVLNGGMVIKTNCNQRYASDAVTSFFFRELGERKGLPVQEFAVRQDTGCGTTIGPILSAVTGIRTVDVGPPMLSMHSAREMMGSEDVPACVRHFQAVFEGFSELDAQLQVDGPEMRCYSCM